MRVISEPLDGPCPDCRHENVVRKEKRAYCPDCGAEWISIKAWERRPPARQGGKRHG